MSTQPSFFRKLLDKYNALCQDLGVDSGACRGCVPIVKFDPEPESQPQPPNHSLDEQVKDEK